MDEQKNALEEEIYLAPDQPEFKEATPEPDDAARRCSAPEGDSIELAPEPEDEVFAVGEIRDLRGENYKVFQMSDDTEQAVYYPETIHVFNAETAAYDEVDNTLYEEEDGRHYCNKRNGFTARFSREETNDEIFSIEKGMHRITISAKKPKKRMGTGVCPRLRKMAKSPAARDTLVFGDVMTATDMEYTVTGNGVKENILVKEKAAVYRYPFVLDCENVAAEYKETDQKVIFSSLETGEEVFRIPSLFMSDANGIVSTGVFYEMKPLSDGKISFTVTADSEWMNAEDRAFPVTIDPQIVVSGNTCLTTYSWDNGYLYNGREHTVGVFSNGASCNASRMYIHLSIPELPRNSRIKKAELKLFQVRSTITNDDLPLLALHHVADGMQLGTCTPFNKALAMDFEKIKTTIDSDSEDNVIAYNFDITAFTDSLKNNESSYPNLVLKMMDETKANPNNVSFFGSIHEAYAPRLIITYESSYGVNTTYRTHSHELGRFGTGSIDLQCGNLMLESEDFAWSGNRMPVTIKHLYTSALSNTQYTGNSAIKLNTADFRAMKVGQGWKLNVMQSMVSTTFQHEGTLYSGYVFIGENGDEAYFKKSDKQICENNSCYNLFVNVTDEDMLYDPYKRTLKKGTETLLFDASGRLIRVTDEFGNHMDITFTSGRITSVTDGAGRDFSFAYTSDGRLTSITAPDGSSVCYTYSTGNFLNAVTYPDGRKAEITYSGNKPSAVLLRDADNHYVYKVAYTYSGSRVYRVSEYGVENGTFVAGPNSTYSFSAAARRTIVQTTELKDADEGETANNVIKTVYTFDDNGQILSEYAYSQDTGNVGVESGGSGINPYAGDTGIVSNADNLLQNHAFNGLDHWMGSSGNCSDFVKKSILNAVYTKFGQRVLYMQSKDRYTNNNGVYQVTNILPAGKYTFSAYLRPWTNITGTYTKPGTFIRVTKTDGSILAESERLTAVSTEPIRLVAPFELTSPMSVVVRILINGVGTVLAQAPQLEKNPFASDYNLVQNGNFENSINGWTTTSGVLSSTTAPFNMSRSLQVTGQLGSERNAYQDIETADYADYRQTFTLSGWAKGYGIVNRERDGLNPPQFRLRAVIEYGWGSGEDGSEEFTADFSPCTEEWQFASIQFTKSRFERVNKVRVYCDYSYNTGTAYFDNIQLVTNSLEKELTSADFETKTVEDTNTPPTEDALEPQTDAPDDDSTPTFEELKDAFGNALTETTFNDGEFGTIYKAFGYTSQCNGKENAGNDLIREIDALGHKTEYTVDEDTSRNEEVTDRCGNKTAYEYDAAGRVAKVTSKNSLNSLSINTTYSYGIFDNLTEITRGDSMKYALAYNAYHNLESIGVVGKAEKLVTYTYKNGNGRLKAITYANGDSLHAIYNTIGEITTEKWYDSANCLTAHYKYVHDGKGNIVRSLDMGQKCEYSYTYEDDKIVRAAEYNITVNGSEMVTSRTLVNSILYFYDKDGKLTSKRIVPASGSTQTYNYENPENGNPVVTFTAGGRTITSHSKTDSFGRKVFDELQLGSGFVSRQFTYHAGKKTDEHVRNDRLKSSPTTQLVSQIVLSDGHILSYEYDAEERITKVTDSVDGVTQYTYDALGQLLTETVNGSLVGSMTYDNYGNILTKGSNTYTYGDSVWKDRLTAFNGQAISYDAQGNPTSYRGKTLTWEKGRQLKSYGSNSYTYNVHGIRTSKNVGGVKHTFNLDNTKLLKETWNTNTLVPIYDNEDLVCGILYNSTPYYFLKNLQGDVIAITNKSGEVVARYTYDAWGKVLKVTNASGTVITSSTNIANVNPFRYRGYYYDTETGLYYLQSRYYDPDAGRFINADDPAFACVSFDPKNHNLFAYCCNDPINNCDLTGTCGISFALAVAAFILACAALLLLLNYMNSSTFKRSWSAFCKAVNNGLSWMGDAISKGGSSAWKWSKKQVKAASSAIAIFIVIAKADAKVRSRVKSARKKTYKYFEIWFDRLGAPILGKSLNRDQAVSRAKRGLNSITYYSSDAKSVANRAGGNKAMWHQKHGGLGYFNHYHVYKHATSAHICYIVGG